MDIQGLVNKARELKQEGKLQQAIACYSDAFDLLTKEANEYARGQEGSVVDVGKLRTIMPQLFEEAKKHLKQDKTATTISNNMGVIFAELGDYESARKFFKQAIDLTPDDIKYDDPKTNLKELDK